MYLPGTVNQLEMIAMWVNTYASWQQATPSLLNNRN